MGPLRDKPPAAVDFLEVAPENWIGVGGKLGRDFRYFTERYPFVAHGLSLSIGSPAPLDETFLRRVRRLLDEHGFRGYSEHLSYCSDDGHLYDLMPIPFTEEAVHYVAARIRRVQDILERRIAMENVSYYAAPGKELEEIDFINAVLAEADCDIRNVSLKGSMLGARARIEGGGLKEILTLNVGDDSSIVFNAADAAPGTPGDGG